MRLAGTTQTILQLIIVLLCLGGAWTSDQLLRVHDHPEEIDRGVFARLCAPTPTGSGGCEQTSRSDWSVINLPLPGAHRELPVAFVGLAYFLCIGIYSAFAGDLALPGFGVTGMRRWWMPLALTVGGGYASLFLFSLMAFGRVPWCVGCVVVNIVNFILIAAIWALWVSASRPLAAPPVIDNRRSYIAAATALMLISVLYANRREQLIQLDANNELRPYRDQVQNLQSDAKLLLSMYMGQARHTFEPRPGETHLPSHHQLVIFSDYECPPCYDYERIVHEQVAKAFNGNLDISLRQYPLCKDCNPRVAYTLHPNACRAAYAAEAARLLGGQAAFDRMSELLFANRMHLEEGIYPGLAGQAGLDPKLLVEKMNGPTVQYVIAQDIALAGKLGVQGTPTLFLDGRLLPGLCQTPVFWEAIAKLPPEPENYISASQPAKEN